MAKAIWRFPGCVGVCWWKCKGGNYQSENKRVASAKEEGESGGLGIAGRIKRYFILQPVYILSHIEVKIPTAGHVVHMRIGLLG